MDSESQLVQFAINAGHQGAVGHEKHSLVEIYIGRFWNNFGQDAARLLERDARTGQIFLYVQHCISAPCIAVFVMGFTDSLIEPTGFYRVEHDALTVVGAVARGGRDFC